MARKKLIKEDILALNEKPRDKEDSFDKRLPDMSVLKRKLVDLFVSPQVCWNPIAVRNAIENHDLGNFNSSGRLVDAMMKESRIMACVNTLTFGILGLPFEWKWQVDDADSGQVDTKEGQQYQPSERDLEYLAITKKWWTKFMESGAPSLIMKTIINMGFCVMSRNWSLEQIEGYESKLYIPNTYIFHPSNVWYNPGLYQYAVNTYTNGSIFIDENDERFQIIKHVDGERPWMQGAVRSVGFLWMDKWLALTDWRAYLGIHGNPLRVLTTNKEYSTPPETDIEQFIINLAISQQYGQPIQIPDGHTLDLLQADSTNVGVFKDKIDSADKDIAIAYLGQNLTTDVSGGSYAAASVHSRVLQDYIEAYATTINRGLRKLVKDFYFFNFPDDVRVPVPYFDPQLPIDQEVEQKATNESVKSLESLSKTIDTLSQVEGGKYLQMIDIEALIKKITK